jgi:hypothetical protein
MDHNTDPLVNTLESLVMVRALFLHKNGRYIWKRDNQKYILLGKAKDWMDMGEHALIMRADDTKRQVIVLPLTSFCHEFTLYERLPGLIPPKEERFKE